MVRKISQHQFRKKFKKKILNGKKIRENILEIFYLKYAVTQEQYDEWEKWAKEYTKKVTKISKNLLERSWWSICLNTSPQIIKEND